jgi:hypothetical protein
MGIEENSENFSLPETEPDIDVGGFRLWINSCTFEDPPESCTWEGGYGDLDFTVHCGNDKSGFLERGSRLYLSDIDKWRSKLALLNAVLIAEEHLFPIDLTTHEADLISEVAGISLKVIPYFDANLKIKLEIQFEIWGNNGFNEFNSDLSQADLDKLIESCRRIYKKFHEEDPKRNEWDWLKLLDDKLWQTSFNDQPQNENEP